MKLLGTAILGGLVGAALYLTIRAFVVEPSRAVHLTLFPIPYLIGQHLLPWDASAIAVTVGALCAGQGALYAIGVRALRARSWKWSELMVIGAFALFVHLAVSLILVWPAIILISELVGPAG